ncbi:MAG: 2-amino-4-hydroxy-6-hydroxymethyldihydropteridine diphosphokinase [Deltaproteobacteria bacterium]|jgi:2-amino-4-hydroxy-6-hydroxymethyldihydropteridine diphosphokinase|nr:2-amino-4-hydroxy-6-hydroxymethyldihydropteridine diphosphokinase [Deltaproteobacteria bacterium]
MDAALAAVALGANLASPSERLKEAAEFLAKTPGLVPGQASRIFITEPVGGPKGQDPYHNQVRLYWSSLEPLTLLRTLLAIENQMGRTREIRWGPRIIDLDLLFCGQTILDEPELTLPHPRLSERAFVLEPLVEIAPDWIHPISGLTVAELWRRLAK